MLSILIETGSTDEAWQAIVTVAENMDPDFAARINNAIRIEGTDMQITDALACDWKLLLDLTIRYRSPYSSAGGTRLREKRRGEFELLAEKLMNPQKPAPRPSPEQPASSGEHESIYDSGWELEWTLSLLF